MSNRLRSFKADIKKAVKDYAIQKAGSIDKLKDHRKGPCEAINAYLDGTTDDWKTIKATVQENINELKTSWLLRRSKLRNMINVVFAKNKYSNDKFYEHDLNVVRKENAELLDENEKLREQNARIPEGMIASQALFQVSTLKTKIVKLKSEVNTLEEKKKEIKRAIKKHQQSTRDDASESDSSDDFMDSYSSFLDSDGSLSSVGDRASFDGTTSLPAALLLNNPGMPDTPRPRTFVPTLFQTPPRAREEIIELEDTAANDSAKKQPLAVRL